MSFEADVRQGEGYAVMDLHGEIQAGADDALSAAYVDAAALSSGAVLLNFADVTYINSTGIALIVGLLAESRKSGRRVVACGLSDHYKEIFEITRISDFVTITDDEGSAAVAAAQG
jgi:anti-sigma B factor antagonist